MECSICRCALVGTIHNKSGYTVDHYKVFTGRTQTSVIKGQAESEEDKRFEKLVEPVHLELCLKCSGKKKVKQAVELFRNPLVEA